MRQQSHWGLIQIFTGHGKGKTTAALGTALRAAAQGARVAIIAFDKGGECHYSEREIVRARIPEIEYFPTGLDRIDPHTGRFRFGVTDEDRAEGARGLAVTQEVLQRAEHRMVILDEVNSSVALGILREADVLRVLDQKPERLELILTGRNAPASFLQRADLVTNMQLVKHYFYQGEPAREGLDF